MNKIQFKLIRESLHLSKTELAELFNINIRTVQSWETGREVIPLKRYNQINEIDVQIDYSAEQFERQLIELRKIHACPDVITLLAYSKNNYDGDFGHYKLHNCLMSRCMQRLKAIGLQYKIIEFDPEKYFSWLKGEDSQLKRAEWASLYDNNLLNI